MFRDRRGLAALVHPIALTALAVWIVNDHYLKRVHAGALSGKLSDVACLIVVPLLAVAAIELVRGTSNRATWIACIAGTGFVMATINLFDSAAFLYRWGLGIAHWPLRVVLSGELVSIHPARLTMDPTDLLTLPALLVPAWLLYNRGGAQLKR